MVRLRAGEHGGISMLMARTGNWGRGSLSMGGISMLMARTSVAVLCRYHGKDGKPAAALGVTEHGGQCAVHGKGEGWLMSINEYGNGAVSTWDKNGYRQ